MGENSKEDKKAQRKQCEVDFIDGRKAVDARGRQSKSKQRYKAKKKKVGEREVGIE